VAGTRTVMTSSAAGERHELPGSAAPAPSVHSQHPSSAGHGSLAWLSQGALPFHARQSFTSPGAARQSYTEL